MEDLEEDAAIRMAVSANLARMYASDQRGFLDSLAAMLESALPGDVRVERRGGVFTEKRTRSVDVSLGDYLYGVELMAAGMAIATRSKLVRGIKLRTETMRLADWLDDLALRLEEYARTNQDARNALQQFLKQ